MTEEQFPADSSERLQKIENALEHPLGQMRVWTELFPSAVINATSENPEYAEAGKTELELLKQAIGTKNAASNAELRVPKTPEAINLLISRCNRAIESLNGSPAENIFDFQADALRALWFVTDNYLIYPGQKKTIHEVKQEQNFRIRHEKSVLAEDELLKELIRDVSKQRFGREADMYEDFDGLRKVMRGVFDFRSRADGSYAERSDADEFICDDDMASRIYTVAEKFGLTGNTVPKDPNAKIALALGGAAKSPLDRTKYLKELIDSDNLRVEMIGFLGSERPVDATERSRAGDYATNALTEFDLMVSAAETVFGETLLQDDIIEGTDPCIADNMPRHYRIAYIEANESHPHLFVLSAPLLTNPFEIRNGIEGRRARSNTRDTFNMLAKIAEFEPGDRAVVVTNAHFRPFQGADAAGQLADFGVDTETVGFDPMHYGNPAKKPNELLQEMLTAADSLANAGK